jgi:23S rRNA (adenine1618-N6)-methyltransferase
MHPRNKHAAGYDFTALTLAVPELARFVSPNPSGRPTVDFADPEAVKTLNRALLKTYYGVAHWDLPPGFLCPPVPGRADYVHAAADLLAQANGGTIPRGDRVRVLDLGVGANCIYPILGRAEYGWRFTGSDVDPAALAAAQKTVDRNPALVGGVDLRRQTAPAILDGLLEPGEFFDLVLCNPPFFASDEEARAAGERKRTNLRLSNGPRNFGGRGGELWTPGGEAAFVRRMIAESAPLGARVRLFTTLISKAADVPGALKTLQKTGAAETRVIEMSQGAKKSRFVAWTFARSRPEDIEPQR